MFNNSISMVRIPLLFFLSICPIVKVTASCCAHITGITKVKMSNRSTSAYMIYGSLLGVLTGQTLKYLE